MNFSSYNDEVVSIAVDLVNEPLDDRAGLVRFLADHDISVARVTARDLDEVRAVRDRLATVFGADDATTARTLNAMVAECDVRPELTDHDGVWHFHYVPEGAGIARRLAASTSMALASVLASCCGAGRLRRCASDTCDDAFVDSSRNGSRRYCCERCSNRANVAAFRARQRTAVGGSSGS